MLHCFWIFHVLPYTSEALFPLLFFFKDFFFLMWTVFNVFIEFVIILPVFYVLFCFGFFLAMRHVRS